MNEGAHDARIGVAAEVPPQRAVTLYVASHDATLGGDYPAHRWVYCGAAAHQRPTSLTDILADGSRLENRRWSELSALYRVWKEGPRSDIVGLCHYRRFFSLNGEHANVLQVQRSQLAALIPSDVEERFRLMIDSRTIAVAKRWRFDESVFQQYRKSHHADDYLRAMAICCRKHPQLAPFIAHQFWFRKIVPFNMFVMTWENFEEICRIWFGTLQAFASKTPWPRENVYQSRDAAFLAERIFDAWVKYKAFRGATIRYLPVYFVTAEDRPGLPPSTPSSGAAVVG
ncbi:MAG: DUF4422 domain-containing protein [Hyphomicrobiales bacterium]